MVSGDSGGQQGMTLTIRSRGSDAQQMRYRVSIERVLEQIRRTRTGRIVLKTLEASPRRVVISPYTRALRNRLGPNASATPGNEDASGTFGAGRTASGTGSFVNFSPGVINWHSPGGTDDEVLLHELCHSLRQTQGAERYSRNAAGNRVLTPMIQGSGGRVGFDNIEEFFAIMVTSIHSSELGRRPRGNHSRSGIPNPDVLRRRPYSTRLRQISVRMPELYRSLRSIDRITAPFNPFRDYVDAERVQAAP